jgi:hypothetical protein
MPKIFTVEREQNCFHILFYPCKHKALCSYCHMEINKNDPVVGHLSNGNTTHCIHFIRCWAEYVETQQAYPGAVSCIVCQHSYFMPRNTHIKDMRGRHFILYGTGIYFEKTGQNSQSYGHIETRSRLNRLNAYLHKKIFHKERYGCRRNQSLKEGMQKCSTEVPPIRWGSLDSLKQRDCVRPSFALIQMQARTLKIKE